MKPSTRTLLEHIGISCSTSYLGIMSRWPDNPYFPSQKEGTFLDALLGSEGSVLFEHHVAGVGIPAIITTAGIIVTKMIEREKVSGTFTKIQTGIIAGIGVAASAAYSYHAYVYERGQAMGMGETPGRGYIQWDQVIADNLGILTYGVCLLYSGMRLWKGEHSNKLEEIVTKPNQELEESMNKGKGTKLC